MLRSMQGIRTSLRHASIRPPLGLNGGHVAQPGRVQVRGIGTAVVGGIAAKIGRVFARLAVVSAVGTSGAYYFLQDFFGQFPQFPKLPNVSNLAGMFQGRFDTLRDMLKVNERRKRRKEEQEEAIEDEDIPLAFKVLAKNTLSAPAPVPTLGPKKTYFGDGDLMYITRRLIELRSTLNAIADLRLQLPTIVVIGAQSSGKSSVLEAIVGHEFLPKGSNMVTRKPLELTLIHTPNSTEEYGEFPQLKITNLKDFNKIREYIQQMNSSVPENEHVSDDPIQLRIYSPYVPDLSLVDLPGYIRVTSDKQPVELKNKIIELCKKYTQEPNLILAISAADVDLANSDSIKESKKADPKGLRTLGVLTKMDTIKPADGADLLRQNDYSLGLGYIGVINRPPEPGGNFEDSDKYFKNNNPYSEVMDRVGIATLREKLVRILEQHMINSLKTMAETVKNELEETQYVLKVDFNDRRISQDYFIANITTTIKNKFYEFSNTFGKNEIQELIRKDLEKRIFRICEEVYWNDPNLRSPLDPKYNSTANPSRSGAYEDPDPKKNPTSTQDNYLRKNLLVATQSLMTIGIGKMTTHLVSKKLQEEISKLTEADLFKSQPEVQEKVAKIASDLLKSREHQTSDLVESIMKAYKRGVDFTQQDWERGYARVLALINEDLVESQKSLAEIDKKFGKKNIDLVIGALQNKYQREKQRKPEDAQANQQLEIDGENVSKQLEDAALESLSLRSRITTLNLRHRYIKNNGYQHNKAEASCPEIYLEVVIEQISKMCALTISTELWDDFAFHFPPQIDEHLYYRLSGEEKKVIIHNDPKVRRHLELLNKRDKLEVANEQLAELLRYYNRIKTSKGW